MVRKSTILFTLTFLGLGLGLSVANAQEDLTSGCLKTSEVKVVAEKFSQFRRYAETEQKEICSEQIGSDDYQILASLILLKNSSPAEPIIDEEDAFTYQAISEKDWWSYFTRRADTLIVDNSCRENVVAYVFGFSNNGDVYLCRPYFESSRSSQASILMHEARHFDGFSHVECTRGNENGRSGACDNRVTDKGSYAISLQTLVGLAQSDLTSENEKLSLESEAIYSAFNKFNSLPKLKMSNYMYLSNDEGEVYRWNTKSSEEPVLQAVLSEPAAVINSSNRFTMYPLNTEKKAYRTERDFGARVDNPGLYAVHFNSLSPQERAEYDSVVYFGDGGLLVNNHLETFCTSSLATKNLSRINNFVRMVSFAKDSYGFEQDAYLLAESGELYLVECESRESSKVNITKSKFSIDSRIAKRVVESFSIDNEQFALLDDGRMVSLELQGDEYQLSAPKLFSSSQNWVGATMLRIPQIFD